MKAPRGVVGWERRCHTFFMFSVCSAMKVNTSLNNKYWLKNGFEVLLKVVSFVCASPHFFCSTKPMEVPISLFEKLYTFLCLKCSVFRMLWTLHFTLILGRVSWFSRCLLAVAFASRAALCFFFALPCRNLCFSCFACCRLPCCTVVCMSLQSSHVAMCVVLQGVSFKTVNYMLGEVNYGGRVTDDYDKRLLNTFCKVWFGEHMFDPKFAFFAKG